MIVESFLVPRMEADPCADRLIIGEYVAGVVDGATRKSWDLGPDGAVLAEAVAGHLSVTGAGMSARRVVDIVTRLVAEMFAERGARPGSGSAVSFCLLHMQLRQVWRIGEARVLVDGEAIPPRYSGESVVAAARALVLRQRLAAGISLVDLVASDPGRVAVQEVLKSLTGMRNGADERYSYAAVDGTPVPSRLLEVISIPPDAREVVITTDGYPEPAMTLAETEDLLADRLRRDPLMIEDPPETKGRRVGANSFDDRAYIRISLVGEATTTELPPRDSASTTGGSF